MIELIRVFDEVKEEKIRLIKEFGGVIVVFGLILTIGIMATL